MVNPMTNEREGRVCIVAAPNLPHLLQARLFRPARTSSVCARSADKEGMEPVLLVATLALSLGPSLAISRAFLACVFHVMTHGRLPFVFYWRRVVFATALFWLWHFRRRWSRPARPRRR